jgi:ribosome-associated protein
MADPIRISPKVLVPGSALEFRAVRSSGPGGQNVNKVASKVELRVDLGQVHGLDPGARARLAALAGTRLDAEGRMVVVSQRTRDQHRNLEDAREKIRALVARALVAPKPRRPTKATAAARERRFEEKRRTGHRKRARSKVASDID